MGRPSVFEVVEGRLSVEGEHGDTVGRVHAVSEELDAEARGSASFLGEGTDSLRDAHDSVLGSFEYARVGVAFNWLVGDFEGNTSWMGHLGAAGGHSVTHVVERQVHVLSKKLS